MPHLPTKSVVLILNKIQDLPASGSVIVENKIVDGNFELHFTSGDQRGFTNRVNILKKEGFLEKSKK